MNTKKTMKPVLQEDNILLQAAYADRWSAIRACGEVLVKQGYVTAAYVEDMLERERLVSVYVGNHVAIPHGIANSEQHILASGLSVLQIPEGVDFDGEKAYIMIGIAGRDGAVSYTHLDVYKRQMQRYMGLRRILRLQFVSCVRVLVPVSWLH